MLVRKIFRKEKEAIFDIFIEHKKVPIKLDKKILKNHRPKLGEEYLFFSKEKYNCPKGEGFYYQLDSNYDFELEKHYLKLKKEINKYIEYDGDDYFKMYHQLVYIQNGGSLNLEQKFKWKWYTKEASEFFLSCNNTELKYIINSKSLTQNLPIKKVLKAQSNIKNKKHPLTEILKLNYEL